MIKFLQYFYSKHTDSIRLFLIGTNMAVSFGFFMGALALFTKESYETVVWSAYGWAVWVEFCLLIGIILRKISLSITGIRERMNA